MLHAAEASAYQGDALRALAWFLAADIPPPIDWLVNVVNAFEPRRIDAREFYGHAVRAAVANEDTNALRGIAERAAARDPQMARLAARAAEGLTTALRDTQRLMRTVRIDISRVILPSRADLDGPPPALPPSASLAEMNHLISRSRSEELPAAFNSLAKAACAYPLIYKGEGLLTTGGNPVWAWRCFEAAEYLRDREAARDA